MKLEINLDNVEETYNEKLLLGMLEELQEESADLDDWQCRFVDDMLDNLVVGQDLTENEISKIKELHEEFC